MKQSTPRYFVSIALPMMNTARYTAGYKMFCVCKHEEREEAVRIARRKLQGTYYQDYPLSISNGQSRSAMRYALLREYPHPLMESEL